MTIKSGKNGYHSTQKKYFGTIPRSEFYGFVLGYAFGLILCGALRIESQIPQLLIAAAGLGIGYFIDKKYFQEPDEPGGSPTEAGVIEDDVSEEDIPGDGTSEDEAQ